MDIRFSLIITCKEYQKLCIIVKPGLEHNRGGLGLHGTPGLTVCQALKTDIELYGSFYALSQLM